MDAIAAALVQSIPKRVARAWGLLCGQQRQFEWNALGSVPALTRHSYLLALDYLGTQDKAGIAVLLSDQDAQDLASAMFRLPASELSADDMEDACMEVCNVLADSISDAIAPKERLHTRLPQPLEANGYRQLLMDGAMQASLNSTAGAHATHLLVFHPLNPSFATRPAPL